MDFLMLLINPVLFGIDSLSNLASAIIIYYASAKHYIDCVLLNPC